MLFYQKKDGLDPEPWFNFNAQVRALCARFDSVNILEIGGGRAPLFALDDLPANVKTYTVNDIEQSELDRVPAGYKTACFDACGDVSAFEGQYDLVISKMLAEHVPDGEKFHANMLRVLKPGGIAFHFFPKLYALPFVINILLPETVSRRILFAFFPNRISHIPKFPAVYSWCSGTAGAIRARIAKLGYTNVQVVPFYGHSYYSKIAGLRQMEMAFRKVARWSGISLISTFVYVFAQK